MSNIDGIMPGLHGAFMLAGFGQRPHGEGTAGGPLSGYKLAVKDVFEIAGLRTGAGNPAWLAEQPLAAISAPAVRLLLDVGAEWVGKTVTDELTYSLAGINAHYGTPVNPAAPDRLPGGSSSGSVVAVAAGHADIALGTDCGGSIRLPASYCGIWGMRPTHGRIAANGCFTLAHSFDTVGWFARDGASLARVFERLAHSVVAQAQSEPRPRLLVSDDVLALLDEPVRDAFTRKLAALSRQQPVSPMPRGSLDLQSWAGAFRILQAAEIWQQHGKWIRTRSPAMGEDVAQRFDAAGKIGAVEVAAAQSRRMEVATSMARTLDAGNLMLMPTVPTTAPRLDAPLSEVNNIRARSQQLLCIAGLAGLPQVSFPWLTVDGAPVGLSVIGPRGGDESVLCAALHLQAALVPAIDRAA
jgi:amidase